MPTSPKYARSAVQTRSRILDAAKRHFTQHGYDGIGVREIANDAGVTAALVGRYFGSKEELFQEAVVDAIKVDDLIKGHKDKFGKEVARRMISTDFRSANFDPMLAFVRSLGSPIVGDRLKRLLDNELVPLVSNWLGGENSKERAVLIFSAILGFDLMRRMARLDAIQGGDEEYFVALMASGLQTFVDGITNN